MTSVTTWSNKTVPGPRGRPIFGSLLEMRRDRLKFVVEQEQRYGPVFAFRAMNLTLYHVSDPTGIQHILQDNYKNYTKGFSFSPTIEMVLGHGLLTNEGEAWRKQRRLMQPVFNHKNVETFGTMMTDAALEMVESWRDRAAQGEVIDVAAELMKVTLTVVNRALFSTDVKADPRRVADAITVLLSDVTRRFESPFMPPASVPTPYNRRLLRAIKTMDEIIYGIIEERRRNPRDVNDLLSLLLAAQEDGQGMDDKQLRDEVITLFIAGHETTAVTLSWAFYLLSQNPEAEERLRGELDRVLGGRPPSAGDYPSLEYTRRVIDETIRLYPPAWLISRQTIEPDEVCGYPIPAKKIVGISPYGVHRSPALWPEPERFDPDRFLPERSAGRHKFAYFPFGGGPRQCIGKGFALMEAPLILATVMQRYRMSLAPGARVVPSPLVTMRPKYGVLMLARVV